MTERDSFTSWYCQEARTVFNAVGIALGDRALAEEVVAEAFARAWANWPRVQHMRSPVGWVYQVALNQARSRFRRRRLEARWTPDKPSAVAPTEVNDELWLAVASLEPRTRLAISLRYIADLPEAEVAALMGVARGTVAATLHRARAQLAEILKQPHEAAR